MGSAISTFAPAHDCGTLGWPQASSLENVKEKDILNLLSGLSGWLRRQKHLLLVHEDLSLDPSTHMSKQV